MTDGLQGKLRSGLIFILLSSLSTLISQRQNFPLQFLNCPDAILHKGFENILHLQVITF